MRVFDSVVVSLASMLLDCRVKSKSRLVTARVHSCVDSVVELWSLGVEAAMAKLCSHKVLVADRALERLSPCPNHPVNLLEAHILL